VVGSCEQIFGLWIGPVVDLCEQIFGLGVGSSGGLL
jgi:hypothetical protein